MANEQTVRWSFPLLDTTLDRSGSRTSTGQNFSHELVGFEAATRGGLRPFPGFMMAHELNPYGDDEHAGFTSRVLDLFPVNFRIGGEDYGYGFVYRAERGAPGSEDEGDVFIDFWNSATEEWTEGVLLMRTVDLTSEMSVEVNGKLVYVYMAGRSPSRFYVREVCVLGD